VPSQERPEEVEVRAVVETILRVSLTHADVNGGDVDYRFTTSTGRSAALEVTTVTSSKTKIARDKWDKESPTFGPAPTLQGCWQVWLEDTDVRYKGLTSRLEPALAVLETAGREFDSGRLHEFIDTPLPLREAVSLLAGEKVKHARRYSLLCRVEGHQPPHRIDIVRQSGYSAAGSDAALTLIEEVLNTKHDNFGKLRGADERHLYVWVDRDTDLAVARPFRGGTATKWDHFGLPTRPPELAEPVDHLWIVDRATSTGWVWTANGWTALDATSH
jgi:hypothetical protein